MSNITAPDNSDEFFSAIKQGFAGFSKAGQIAKEQIQKDPEWPDRVEEAAAKTMPMLTAGVVRRFAKFADIHPALMFAESPGARALRNCDISVQKKHVSEGIPLLLANGDSLLVQVGNLTPDQTNQVFDGKQIRDLAGQRAWIESQKTAAAIKMAPVKSDLPYRITGGKLVVTNPYTFTRKELARVLVELE